MLTASSVLTAPQAPTGLARSLAETPTTAINAGVQAKTNSFDDPANFRELPDMSLLDKNHHEDPKAAIAIREALTRARAVLLLPKIPAEIWRVWRDFEKSVQMKLRG